MIDPSGHKGCKPGQHCPDTPKADPPVPGISQEQHERLRELQKEAVRLSSLMHSGEITDLEALAQLLEYSTSMYGDNVESMLTDLGIVVGGLNGTTVIGQNDPMSTYYVGYDAFNPDAGTTGFSSTYNPNDDNQFRHFLAGASASENYGGIVEAYLLWQEPSAEEDALYRQAFTFVAALNDRNFCLDARAWVRVNLAK